MKKNDLLKCNDRIIRILEIKDDSALIVNCIHKAMPKWVQQSELSLYADCAEQELTSATNRSVCDYDSLDKKSRQLAHEHFTLIAGVLAYLPESERELSMILRREHTKNDFRAETGDIDDHIRSLAVNHGKVAETLAPLPVAELRKYEAIKAAHPDAFVCFAQNGYFELYGNDALKAAPLLGTKVLEKKVHGKGYLAVTGFRESAWVSQQTSLKL